MGVEELDKLLEESDDKFEIFTSRDTLKQYKLTIRDVLDLIDKYLSDEEKLKAINLPHFNPRIQNGIVELIKDENIIMQVLKTDSLLEKLDEFNKIKIIKGLSEKSIFDIVTDLSLIEKINIGNYAYRSLIESLSQDKKISILENKELLEASPLNEYGKADLIVSLNDEKIKLSLMEKMELSNFEKKEIIKTVSDSTKINIIKNNKELDIYDKQSIACSMEPEYIIELINEEKNLENLVGKAYSLISRLDTDKQIKIIENFEKLDLDDIEKRKILVTLKEETKEQINKENMPKEYVDALNLKVHGAEEGHGKKGKIKLDFEKEPEVYKGLEELMYINPMDLSDEERTKLVEFCKNMPDIEISDDINLVKSTASEYIEGEKWINSVIEGINPEWSDIQKVAYIDNAIGKKISYSPDFDTERYNGGDSRALWKIITSGKGVCNGISQIEKYIFDRVGIESEMASSGIHAFIKLKNIEIPTEEGIKKGDTILDPTWNLADQRYGAMPSNFCVSYEEVRKHDVNKKGIDCKAHKNDEQLKDATLNMDKDSLRQIYKSVGLTLEDGSFPLKKLAVEIEKCNGDKIKDIEERLKILEQYYPEFASCMQSTIEILASNVLNKNEINADKCVIDRVYNKQNENKEPQLYVYANFEGEGEVFFTAGENDKEFIKMSKEEFIEKYDCYEEDIQKNDGKRLWEIEDKGQIITEKPELIDPKKKAAVAKQIEDNER